jgi:hypothetical protein
MSTSRTRGRRLVALVVAATLISGGAAGLSTGHQVAVTVSSAVSVLAGLIFLRIAARRE